MKKSSMIAPLIAFTFVLQLQAQQEDNVSCKDHPLFTRGEV